MKNIRIILFFFTAFIFAVSCASKNKSAAIESTDVKTDARPSLGNIYSMPAKLNFGKVKVGTKHKSSFLIFNRAPLDVNQDLLGGLSLMGDSGPFQVDDRACRRIPKDSSCKVTVTYKPQAPGKHYATIKTMGRITKIETMIEGQAR